MASDGRIEKAFLGKKYIYIICSTGVEDSYQKMLYVVDAENIRKTVDLGELKMQQAKVHL